MEYIIIFGLRGIGREGMEWIDLAHDMDEWCNVVYAVMKHSDIRNARHAVAQLVEALQAGRSRVRFLIVSMKFFIGIILPAAL
jgi:3'-phosphoadenosine 5'-phosphosulfate sulfotransferase